MKDTLSSCIYWVNPGPEQRDATWDDYVESGVLTAIKVVKTITTTKSKRTYWVNGDWNGGPEHWFRTAESHPGSWWTHWSNWLKQFAGKQKKASKTPGNKQFPVIEAAPGRDVMKRA